MSPGGQGSAVIKLLVCCAQRWRVCCTQRWRVRSGHRVCAVLDCWREGIARQRLPVQCLLPYIRAYSVCSWHTDGHTRRRKWGVHLQLQDEREGGEEGKRQEYGREHVLHMRAQKPNKSGHEYECNYTIEYTTARYAKKRKFSTLSLRSAVENGSISPSEKEFLAKLRPALQTTTHDFVQKKKKRKWKNKRKWIIFNGWTKWKSWKFSFPRNARIHGSRHRAPMPWRQQSRTAQTRGTRMTRQRAEDQQLFNCTSVTTWAHRGFLSKRRELVMSSFKWTELCFFFCFSLGSFCSKWWEFLRCPASSSACLSDSWLE